MSFRIGSGSVCSVAQTILSAQTNNHMKTSHVQGPNGLKRIDPSKLTHYLRISSAFRLAAAALGCCLAAQAAPAQSAAPNPLRDQLAAQYKPAKITFGAKDATVADPGAILVVQVEGIIGVPHGSAAPCPVTFKDGALAPPGASCTAPAAKRLKFQLQDKVYLSKLSVSRASDTVTMTILSCEACSGAEKSSYNQGEVVFQYPKGYLASADAGQVEDVIGQVLGIYNAAADAQQAQSAASGSMSNADVIKLVKAGMPESLIIAKIKSSACDFNTSPDALIKLKGAGVSDKVLEAMVAAPSASAAATAAQAAAAAPTGCGDYNSCMQSGQASASQGAWDQAITSYQQAATANPSAREPLDQLALAYLTLGRNEDLTAVLDRILQMGQPVTMLACRERSGGCESGVFSMSAAEVSFQDEKNHVVFAVPPSGVGNPEARQKLPAKGDAPFIRFRVGGKDYNLNIMPPADSCAPTGEFLKCPTDAQRQQLAMDHYVVRTLPRLAGAH